MMKTLNLLLKTLVIAFGLGILIGGVVWFVGWRSPTHLSNALFLFGAILITIGILSMLGSNPAREDHKMLWAESIGDFMLFERSQRWLEGMMQGYKGFSLLLLPGLYLLGFAVLIPHLF